MTAKTSLLATFLGVWTCFVVFTAVDAAPLQVASTTSLRSGIRMLDQMDLIGYGGNPPAYVFPLQECEGDCDDDDDCEDGLVCYQRSPGMAVPGCEGGPPNQSKTDYCVKKGLTRSSEGGSSTLSFETTGGYISDSDAPASSASSMGFMFLGGFVTVVAILVHLA